MDVTATTRPVTLLGHPVEHSLSPRIHNAAFEAQGMNAVYLASRVPSDALPAALEGLRALQFLGANVTVPHKEAVVSLLDTVTERADAVGAVNTIVRVERQDERDALRGDNTDVEGFLEPLETLDAGLAGRAMLVFGAGGAARAVVYGLLDRYTPGRLTIVARRPEQAEALAADFSPYDSQDALQVTTFEDAGPAVRSSHLLVNATPLGMHPNPEGTPWSKTDDLGPDQFVYDLVYNPEDTRLLRDASAQGAATIGGLKMLVGQAAAAYRQWTGHEMPRRPVYEALREG